MSDLSRIDDVLIRHRAAVLLGALDQQSRIRLLAAVTGRDPAAPVSLERLADELGIGLAETARDVAVLADAGLVTITGHQVTAALTVLGDTADALVAGLPIMVLVATDPELARFFRHGRLSVLPVAKRRADRRRLGELIVSLIPEQTTLTEAEVNTILHQVMDDHAQLRRFLVDEGLLVRQAGRDYRRP